MRWLVFLLFCSSVFGQGSYPSGVAGVSAVNGQSGNLTIPVITQSSTVPSNPCSATAGPVQVTGTGGIAGTYNCDPVTLTWIRNLNVKYSDLGGTNPALNQMLAGASTWAAGTTGSNTIQYLPTPTNSVQIPQQVKNDDVVSITGFGCKADNGTTDNTTCLNNAFTWATAHPGSRISIPCVTGSDYVHRSTLNMPLLSTLVQGAAGQNCGLRYSPSFDPGVVPAAYNAIGSANLTIDGLDLKSDCTFPPSAVLLAARKITSHLGGGLVLRNSTVEGCYTTALVYSVSQENSHIINNSFVNRGTSPIQYYTSGNDDLGICTGICDTAASNLNITIEHNRFTNSVSSQVIGLVDVLSGGTGNHHIFDNYFGMGTNAASEGIRLLSGNLAPGGASFPIVINGTNRIEGGGYGVHFVLNSQTAISNVSIHDLTFDSAQAIDLIFADNGLTLSGVYFLGSANANATTNAYSVDTLTNSFVDLLGVNTETFTIRTAQSGNVLNQRPNTTIAVPAGTMQSSTWLNLNTFSGLLQGRGSTITSASSISITNQFHLINGSTNVATITGPSSGLAVGATVTLQNAGSVLLCVVAGGNINTSNSCAPPKFSIDLWWDGTNWNPRDKSMAQGATTNNQFARWNGTTGASQSSFDLFGSANTFTQPQTMPTIVNSVNAVASSATPAFNLALGTYQTNILTANVTSFTVTGITAGGRWCLSFPQNGTGGFTVNGAPSNVHGFIPIPVGQAANTDNTQCFISKSSTTDIYSETTDVVAGSTNSVVLYGAVANMVERLDGVCNTTTTFTSATGSFTSADTGKFMEIVGCNANGATWHGTITYVSATQVTLSVAATASATVLKYAYGTPSNVAWQSCLDSVGAYGTCTVPPAPSCPSGARCGYIFNITDQQTAHSPAGVKIRFPGQSLIGQGGRVDVACSGWPATYTNSTLYPSSTALIRGNCINIGDQDGALGTNGLYLKDIFVQNLALDGMTTGQTGIAAFTPTTAPCTTTFDCWDQSNKGIYTYGSSAVNNIHIHNVWAHNFKGEIIFSGGNMKLADLLNSDIGDSNADCISWSADDYTADGNEISNCWNAGVENGTFSTTKHHVYRNNRIFNQPGEGIVLSGVDSAANGGPLEIINNTFNQIASQSTTNSSTQRSAIYVAGQGGTCSGVTCVAPQNVLIKGNSCLDCREFAMLNTSGHTEVTNNTFGVDSAGSNAFMEFWQPQTDVLIANNSGFITANAITNGFYIAYLYILNPTFGTQTWSGLKFQNNMWNVTGTSTQYYQFAISSGSGFAAVTNKYPIYINDQCLGCGFSGTDTGQQNLATSSTVKPVGPEVHVFDSSAVTATIDAAKMQDGATVKIVNVGSTTITFAADSNIDTSASVTLTANQSAIFRKQDSESKVVFISR